MKRKDTTPKVNNETLTREQVDCIAYKPLYNSTFHELQDARTTHMDLVIQHEYAMNLLEHAVRLLRIINLENDQNFIDKARMFIEHVRPHTSEDEFVEFFKEE